MQLNFYRKLEIKPGQTILLENPSRTFQSNFSSNVPRGCTVLYIYKNTPVEMAILWIDKKTKIETIPDSINDLVEKTVSNGIIWVFIDFEAKEKEIPLLEAAKMHRFTITKKDEIYKNFYGIRLTKL